MKTIDLIKENEVECLSVLFEVMQPKLKSLYIYYKSLYFSEPILLGTSVTNATCYVKIVSENDYDYYLNEWSEGEESEKEIMNFNSRMLKDMIN
jgi:hypothetical protein